MTTSQSIRRFLELAPCQIDLSDQHIDMIDQPERDERNRLEISTRILAMRLSTSQLLQEFETMPQAGAVIERLARYERLVADAHQTGAGLAVAFDAAMAFVRTACDTKDGPRMPEGFRDGFNYFLEQHDALATLLQDAPTGNQLELWPNPDHDFEREICGFWHQMITSRTIGPMLSSAFGQAIAAAEDYFAAAAMTQGEQASLYRKRAWLILSVACAALSGQAAKTELEAPLSGFLAERQDRDLRDEAARLLRKIERQFRL